jgi:hypothetical protein
MNVRDITYETARQFSEIAASQHWIEARIGDLNRAAQEVTAALKDQQKYFNAALGIAKKRKKKRRGTKKPLQIVKRAKKPTKKKRRK